jgi:hypothetical protein
MIIAFHTTASYEDFFNSLGRFCNSSISFTKRSVLGHISKAVPGKLLTEKGRSQITFIEGGNGDKNLNS